MTFLLSLLTGPFGSLIKWGLGILAILAFLFGVYEYGHSKGYTVGYQAAWNIQQTTINNMVTAQNAQNAANNTKIQQLEESSSAAAQKIQQLATQANQTRTQVVTKYIQSDAQSSSCGLDVSAVQAINNLIEADPSIVQPASGVSAK